MKTVNPSKKTKVVLFDPGYGTEGFNSFGRSYYTSRYHYGLCSLSANLKKNGFQVFLIDIRLLKNWDHFKEEIVTINPDVVGFTMRTLDYEIVLRAMDLTRDSIDCKIVLGGIHPSLYSHEFRDNKNVDYIITGEGEISFPILVDNFQNGRYPSDKVIKGIMPALDDLPYADYELYDFEKCIRSSAYGGSISAPSIQILVSRGCAFNCKFCQPAERNIYGRNVRYRSVQNVFTELLELKAKYKINSVHFHDDHLLQNKEWIKEFIDNYPKELNGVGYMCSMRSDSICKSESLIEGLTKIGLKQVIVGFESGSQRVLKFLRKGTTVEQNLMAARILHKHKLFIAGNYMLGIPTETNQEAQSTVEMAKKINAEFPSVSFYTPIPGSDLYQYCIDNDLSLLKDYKDCKRDPTMPKVKGVDYEFLHRAFTEIMGTQFKFKIMGKITKLIYVNTKNMPLLRGVLSKAYTNLIKIKANKY